jgi:hypothetical protein
MRERLFCFRALRRYPLHILVRVTYQTKPLREPLAVATCNHPRLGLQIIANFGPNSLRL